MAENADIEYKKVTDLVYRDIIDLEGDKYADPHGVDELMAEAFAEVANVEHDTIDGVPHVLVTVNLIWEDVVVAFPVDHMVPLGKEL
ncbi:MAG: hypothetical protein H9W81_08825 [Enterococcus sp.]|nr:hypothetical protein [Enterococcus sp.]